MSQDYISVDIDRAKTLAELLAVLPAINQELDRGGTAAGGLASPLPNVLERLKHWLDKLLSKLAEIADNLGALSYAVSVGAPVGVSLTVTFGRGATAP
ncbi:MAG: hypothetical protein ABSF27_09600 [Candidatus Dormibacteria bacterium]